METLALIETLDRDGQPRQILRVSQWPVRIGRAIDCDLVLDDPHVAAHHATLALRDDGVHIEPAPSLNGVRLGRATIAAGTVARLPPAGLLTIGTTTLRIRLAGEALVAEQRLPAAHAGSRKQAAWLFGLVLVAAMWTAFSQWLSAAPGESGTAATGLYLAAPIGLGIWCGLWALGSKLFQRQFAFWPHLEAALFWPLVAVFAEGLAGQLAFAFSMPVIAKAGHVVAFLALAMLLWRHLSIVLPARRRAFAYVIAALVTVGGGLDIAERARHQEPLIGSLYLGTISVPGVRVAKPVSADAFVQSAQPIEKRLSQWSKKAGDDADEPDSDDDE